MPGEDGGAGDGPGVAGWVGIVDDSTVITVRTDMPEGVLGFDISGEVTRADYDDVLMPPIIKHIESGAKVRALVQIGPDFEGYEAGAVWEDLKAGGEFGIGRHSSWEKIAVVTDSRKLKALVSAFGWMSPGEIDVFRLDELEAAKTWTAG